MNQLGRGTRTLLFLFAMFFLLGLHAQAQETSRTFKIDAKTNFSDSPPAGARFTVLTRDNPIFSFPFTLTIVGGPGQGTTFSPNPVPGYITPAPYAFTLGLLPDDGVIPITFDYIGEAGRLVINVVNGSAGQGFTLPGEAGWEILSEPGDFGDPLSGDATGLNDLSAPTGDYTVGGKDVANWVNTVSVSGGSTDVAPSGSNSSTLSEGGTLEFTVTYTRQVGMLKIDLVNGSSADYSDPSGWGWTLTGKPSDYPGAKPTDGNGNHTDNSAPTGDYTIEGKDIDFWSFDVTSVEPSVAPSAASKSGRVYESSDTTFTVTYTRQTGELIIDIVNGSDPDYTLPSTAGWTLISSPDGYTGDTQGSAPSYSPSVAPAGKYTLKPNDIPGWIYTVDANQGPVRNSPARVGRTSIGNIYDQDILLNFVITYERITGILQVKTQTFDDRDLPVGAGWDLTHDDPGDYIGDMSKMYNAGESSPQSYNDREAASGDYSLTGKPVVGWAFDVTVVQQDLDDDVSPSAEMESGEIIDGDTALIFTVTYTINSYDVGAIYWDPVNGVAIPGGTITPSDDTIEHGLAQHFIATTLPTNYELTGGSEFTGTSTLTNVNIGTGVAVVNGVTSDGTMRIDVKLNLGELEVIILPESIRPQAGWKFQGGGAYKPSSPNPAGTEALINGFYDLEFADVDGWFAPDPIKDIQVLPNQKRVVTVVYTENPAGSLQVFIEDNFDDRVHDLGAQWQPVFPAGSSIGTMLADTWYNSGDIIAGLDPGSVGIRFKTLAGWVLPELGGATIEEGKTTRETGEYYRVLVIHKSDYNGDGTDDLAVFDKAKGMWSVASIGKPAAIPGAVDLFEEKFGRSDDIPTAGDYDGDGVADLAYWREATGEWRVSRQFKLKNFGQMQDIPVPGDYNGDGMTDPALFRPSTGEWIIYNAETKKTTKVSFGAFGDVPVPGNYDADEGGMTDLAIFNVETRKWRVAIYDANKDAWVEKKKVKVNGKRLKLNGNHGGTGHVPVHADYDGDGATDFAVYKRRPSEWNVRGQFEIQLGVRGDVPVPNDWAGLGRVIPTIFHPKNGRWVAIDNLLRTKHGRGGQPLMSGR